MTLILKSLKETEGKTVRLSRLGAIFVSSTYRLFLVTFSILLVFAIIDFLMSGTYAMLSVASCAVLFVSIMLEKILREPKTLTFVGSGVEFSRIEFLNSRHTMGNCWYVRATYSLLVIRNIEIRQNFFERLFNVGRIIFYGNPVVSAKCGTDRLRKTKRFEIAGIKDFKSLLEDIDFTSIRADDDA